MSSSPPRRGGARTTAARPPGFPPRRGPGADDPPEPAPAGDAALAGPAPAGDAAPAGPAPIRSGVLPDLCPPGPVPGRTCAGAERGPGGLASCCTCASPDPCRVELPVRTCVLLYLYLAEPVAGGAARADLCPVGPVPGGAASCRTCVLRDPCPGGPVRGRSGARVDLRPAVPVRRRTRAGWSCPCGPASCCTCTWPSPWRAELPVRTCARSDPCRAERRPAGPVSSGTRAGRPVPGGAVPVRICAWLGLCLAEPVPGGAVPVRTRGPVGPWRVDSMAGRSGVPGGSVSVWGRSVSVRSRCRPRSCPRACPGVRWSGGGSRSCRRTPHRGCAASPYAPWSCWRRWRARRGCGGRRRR